jgi:hypothetical protein
MPALTTNRSFDECVREQAEKELEAGDVAARLFPGDDSVVRDSHICSTQPMPRYRSAETSASA